VNPGTTVQFNAPKGVAIDPAGNLYVTEWVGGTVQKITPAGVVTLFAGNPNVSGSADGTGSAATFNHPVGIAADSQGNLYVADNFNNALRKITPSGVVSTLAGNPAAFGSTDGPPGVALLDAPTGVAVDGAGNVYVANTGNDCAIRKVAPDGTVSTLAGAPNTRGFADGTGPAAQFNTPMGLALDAAGNLYVADSFNYTIRKVTPAGAVSTIAGTPGVQGTTDGTGSAALFMNPNGVAVDSSGNVFVADFGGNAIRRITPQGVVTTVAGSYQANPTWVDGTGSGAQFVNPGDLKVGPNGVLYIVDVNDNTLRLGINVGNSWLSNLSARAYVEGGQNQLIAGFVTTGGSSKSLLLRGDGPTLSTFGITDFPADPQLSLVNSTGASIATATSWASSLTATFAQVGAFPFQAGSHDAALLQSLAPGAYTAQISSASSNQGVSIAEIYDADSSAPTDRLANLSARAFVQTGGNILIGGFVVGGTTDATLLIRADGPSLNNFGITNSLAAPVLTVYNSSGAVIATNTGWQNAITTGSGAVLDEPGATLAQPSTAAIHAQVGAFSLKGGSADSAMVVTLPPGSYTAQVAGQGGTTGVALVEIYQVQ
jgi:sugar lactone lactonase YvrE